MSIALRMKLLTITVSLMLSVREARGAAEDPKEISIEEFLQSLSTVQGVIHRRDPFARMGPPYEASLPKNESGAVVAEDPFAPNLTAPVLERYAVADYEVVAVLLGDEYPRALVRVPAAEGAKKVVIVKENDKIGNRKGVISKILQDGLVVVQAEKFRGVVNKSETLLKVGGKADDQRRAAMQKLTAKQQADVKEEEPKEESKE